MYCWRRHARSADSAEATGLALTLKRSGWRHRPIAFRLGTADPDGAQCGDLGE
jgi:hypothetical protein